MDIESFRLCCLSLPEATEDMPFGEDVVTFRLKNKIFAALSLSRPDIAVLKCDPERALELREQFASVEGAWHWNKKYWNQIHLDAFPDSRLLEDLVRHAWQEVNRSLPKKHQLPPIDQMTHRQ